MHRIDSAYAHRGLTTTAAFNAWRGWKTSPTEKSHSMSIHRHILAAIALLTFASARAQSRTNGQQWRIDKAGYLIVRASTLCC
jgi:hypothetical protein